MSDMEFLDELQRFSARIGADPTLVQAAGGNTSLKQDDALWIKASGLYLARALECQIMVPVDLAPMMAALERGDTAADQPHNFTVTALNPSGLRPSIETVVHAVMPYRVVVHVHCVETLAVAVRRDSRAILTERLDGLNWTLIPYIRPGLPLARAIMAERRADTDVLILGNHGLVVGADSVEEAEVLMRRVVERLRQTPRAAPPADLAALAKAGIGAPYRLPAEASIHEVACDPISLRLAAGGSLYPDHVIFLGRGSVIAEPGQTAAEVAATFARRDSPAPPAILFPGLGVLIHTDAAPGVEPLSQCLSLVTARVPENAPVGYLSMDDESELLGWNAEKYRQSLNRLGAA